MIAEIYNKLQHAKRVVDIEKLICFVIQNFGYYSHGQTEGFMVP